MMLCWQQLHLLEVSVRKAADEKGVSKSALSRYVMKYGEDENAILTPNYTHRFLLMSKSSH